MRTAMRAMLDTNSMTTERRYAAPVKFMYSLLSTTPQLFRCRNASPSRKCVVYRLLLGSFGGFLLLGCTHSKLAYMTSACGIRIGRYGWRKWGTRGWRHTSLLLRTHDGCLVFFGLRKLCARLLEHRQLCSWLAQTQPTLFPLFYDHCQFSPILHVAWFFSHLCSQLGLILFPSLIALVTTSHLREHWETR